MLRPHHVTLNILCWLQISKNGIYNNRPVVDSSMLHHQVPPFVIAFAWLLQSQEQFAYMSINEFVSFYAPTECEATSHITIQKVPIYHGSPTKHALPSSCQIPLIMVFQETTILSQFINVSSTDLCA